MLRRIFFIITLCLVAGCTPALGNRGIGQDLYSSQTSLATNNIASYFGELCNQTHLQRSGTSAHCSDYSMLVQAGFNDIDGRCDHYLAWIDTKRAEAGRVHSSLVALGSAATRVLTIASASTDTIAYVAQALGLTSSLYDAFNNSMLMGLESSTIKRIVYERRLEFRRQFMQVTFSKSPEMVFALRGYLRICTPQTIVLDANTYALAAASGIAPQSLADSVQQEVDAISAFKSGKGPATARFPARNATRSFRRTAAIRKPKSSWCNARSACRMTGSPGLTRWRAFRTIATPWALAIAARCKGQSSNTWPHRAASRAIPTRAYRTTTRQW